MIQAPDPYASVNVNIPAPSPSPSPAPAAAFAPAPAPVPAPIPSHESDIISHPSNIPSPTTHHPETITYIPNHIPHDMYPSHMEWVWESHIACVRPKHWKLKEMDGPSPFITKRVYTLPESHIDIWWESRPYRKQVAMYIDYTSTTTSYTSHLHQQRAHARLPWYRRIFHIHLNHISWWSVLCWNIGSHAFLYAGICLFIPFFNKDYTLYAANNGWTSIFLGGISWCIASLLECIPLIHTSWPHGYWYLYPRTFIQQMKYIICCCRNQYLISKHNNTTQHRPSRRQSITDTTDTQHQHHHHSRQNSTSGMAMDGTYDDHSISQPPSSGSSSSPLPSPPPDHDASIWYELSTYIVLLRTLGCLIWLISTIIFSGSFHPISTSTMIGGVFFPLIGGAMLFIVSGYLAICEITHSWKPWKASIPTTWRSTHWWITFTYLCGSFSFLAYGICLCIWSSQLNQSQGPAYPFLIGAILFTASDWGQLLEQGDQVGSQVWNKDMHRKIKKSEQMQHIP